MRSRIPYRVCSCMPNGVVTHLEARLLKDLVNREIHPIRCAESCKRKFQKGSRIGDLCADQHSETPIEYTERGERQVFVQKLLSECDERTKTIFKLRFGLGVDGDPEEYMIEHTLEEIGDLLTPKITRERVRQIVQQQITRWKLQYGDRFDI